MGYDKAAIYFVSRTLHLVGFQAFVLSNNGKYLGKNGTS